MLSIRLSRMGRRNRPYYRIVLADSKRARGGRFLEVLGHYDPIKQPEIIEIDVEKVEDWISKGAQPSDTVKSLLKKIKNKESSRGAAEKQQEVKE
jgi:small subunit ribosomal protein S16